MSQTIPEPIRGQFQTAESIQTWLIDHLAERLDVDPEEIDTQASFESYNLASSDALAVLSKLEKGLGRSIPPTVLWNYPNIELLSQRLAEEDDETET
ncbi:MAG: acyl carrier protein [Scytonema sp. PMC 1069.18]|nr:acyl carrier protein [Scytonema sp. PMC 1069.18]MEC4882108.1 acyl carrier protein [Scytonema sp. PMC 1070.18]